MSSTVFSSSSSSPLLISSSSSTTTSLPLIEKALIRLTLGTIHSANKWQHRTAEGLHCEAITASDMEDVLFLSRRFREDDTSHWSDIGPPNSVGGYPRHLGSWAVDEVVVMRKKPPTTTSIRSGLLTYWLCYESNGQNRVVLLSSSLSGRHYQKSWRPRKEEAQEKSSGRPFTESVCCASQNIAS